VSASGDGGILPIIRQAQSAGGLQAILLGGVGGVILAFFQQIIGLVRAIFGFFVEPLTTFTGAIGQIILALFGGVASIIGQGAATTVASIAPRGAFAFGPLTFVEGIGAAFVGLFAVVLFLSSDLTGNVIPGTFTDIPIIGLLPGVESPEEESNESNDNL